MNRMVFIHANVFSKGKFHADFGIVVEGRTIVRIGKSKDIQDALQQNEQLIDCTGDYLVPGFIDMHIHGIKSFLVDNSRDDIEQISAILPQYGTTSFLPTIIPHFPAAAETTYLQDASKAKASGANILGYFCEGPFIAKTGAIRPEALRDRTFQRLKTIQNGLHPYKAIFAISPELEDIESLLPHMETPIFITHTGASVEQTERAIELGARHATHFYDVFPIPESKDPGVRAAGAVEAILADPKVSVDFILDGVHVHPAAVRLAKACKPIASIALITDSNLGAGFPPGTYKGIGGDEISFAYPGAPARGTQNSHDPNGLYGSGLTLDRAVRNVLEFHIGTLEEAISMASSSPANILGLSDKGDLRQGFDADIVRLSTDLKVLSTWVGGKKKY